MAIMNRLVVLKLVGNLCKASKATVHTSSQHEAGGMSLWKKFSLFGAVPCVAILTLKTVLEVKSDPAHHERPEFIAYEHLRIRNKRYPWGEGQKTLFHNPHTNPLPSGYED